MTRDQPIARQRNPLDANNGFANLLFPSVKIHCSGERSHRDKLRECKLGLFSQSSRSFEGVLAVGGQAEDKGPQNVHAMPPERAKALHKAVSAKVEILIHGFQAFRCNGLYPD